MGCGNFFAHTESKTRPLNKTVITYFPLRKSIFTMAGLPSTLISKLKTGIFGYRSSSEGKLHYFIFHLCPLLLSSQYDSYKLINVQQTMRAIVHQVGERLPTTPGRWATRSGRYGAKNNGWKSAVLVTTARPPRWWAGWNRPRTSAAATTLAAPPQR